MLRNWQAFGDLAKRFAGGDVCLRVAGLAGSARALAVAELLQIHPRPVLVIVASLADAHRFAQDLKFFGAPAFEFPERELQLWKGGHHREAEAERAMIVRRLTAGEPIAVVVTPAALDTPLPAPGEFREGTLRLATKDSLDRELLLEALEKAGYERTDTVVEVGQWSARGGIVDVFSPMHPSPARLEFDGDDIESIRLFDPTTQRSTGSLDELLVLPLVAVPETADADATRLLQYLPAGAPVIVDGPPAAGGDHRRATSCGARSARGRGGRRHPRGALRRSLLRQVRPARRRRQPLARRGFHRPPRGRRSRPGRAPARDPSRPRPRHARGRCARVARLDRHRGRRVVGRLRGARG